MIYFLLIAASISNVLQSISSLSCPSDTVQIGGINSDIAGCGLEGCNARYQDHYQSIEDCRDGCKSRTDCKSFTWASLNGDKNHPGKTVCTLYDSDTPNQRWEPDQIMCEPSPISTTAFPTTTSQPIGDIICNTNENCDVICDTLDPINGCSNSIINAKLASSLHILCSSSKNDFYGGCEFSTIWCPLIGECNIECIDYYACYLTKIYASYTNADDDDEFETLLIFGSNPKNNYKEIGPYKDTTSRALRYGPHAYGYTAEQCLVACNSYKYFALQNSGWCCCDSDLLHATMYGTAVCGKTGGGWCNYIYQNLNYNYSRLDVGKTAFNAAFSTSGFYIIRRECSQCIASHQVIYYKRISDPLSFDAYGYMSVWKSNNNILGKDFNLYSSLQDALSDTNAWTYCNYDDAKVGAFRDCGPFGEVRDQWCSKYGRNECQFSVYIPSEVFGNSSVHITCKDVDGSCLKTTLYANDSNDVNISCYGSGILSSRLHSSCDGFTIHAERVTDNVYLRCSDDYSCYKMNIFAENANNVHVFARGSYALSSSYIHAEETNTLDVFCGSQQSEYGCYKLYLFNPQYRSHQDIPTNIHCQGHGCFDGIYTFSANGGLDLDIDVNGCGECHNVETCLGGTWSMYCGSDKSKYDILHGDVCNSTVCHCNYALNTIKSNWVDTYATCDIFTTDYICEADKDCIIDCMEEWPDNNGCYDKVIHAENATSLIVICDSISAAPVYGACESSHIFGPTSHNAECHIQCQNKDACYDTELSVHSLNLTCVDSDSCSHTNVYGANKANIDISCIDSDSCFDMNVTANDADNIRIWCQGNDMHSSYSACAQFNVFGVNVANDIELVCKGDSSCHNVDIFANDSNHVIVDVLGGYAGYDGDIYAMNAQQMDIMCSSGYGYYGCYNMHFYIAPFTSIECIGNGCNGLQLYALNGFLDIKTLSINGCKQCSTIGDCVSELTMHCDKTFSIHSAWNEDQCNNEMEYEWNDDECAVFESSTTDHICTNNEECVVDCSADSQCSKMVITGGNASSLTVHCGDRGCYTSTIYCPHLCNVICNGSSACDYSKVYADDNSIFNLKCGQLSCQKAEIHIENALDVNIQCDGSMSCSYMTVIGDYATNVNLKCSGDYLHEYLSACNEMNIYTKNAKQLGLSCIGSYSCSNNLIYANNAQKVWITSIGSNSIYYGSIYTQNASYLSLDLSSTMGSKSGVEHINLFIPSRNTHLNCVGFGCHNMEIFAKDGMKVMDYISFDGCQECISPETCIGNWQLYCGDFSDQASATFTGSSCIEYNCDCNDLQNEIEEAWIKMDNVNDECALNNITADIICQQDTECLIDCGTTNCQRKLIYGYKATSLNIHCDNDYSCEYINVYCPEAVYSQCNVECDAHESCYSMEIHGNTHNTIHLQCSSTMSCANTNVYADESMDINILCNGMTNAHYSSDSACFNLKIYASFVRNSVSVECHDEYACYHTVLYADNANKVEVLADNGYAAMEYMYIYAQNASVFHLICIGSSSSRGCYYANIYLPQTKDSTTISCYGAGCSFLYLYVPNGMKSLSLSNIVLNACSNHICDSPTSCISQWNIYCNDWKENLEPFDTNIVFYGSSCSKYSYHCGCASYLNLLTDVFIINSSQSECAIINDEIYSTMTVTDSFESSQNQIYLYVILISTILLLCITINIVYCKYRTRKLQRIHKQLQDAQAEGDLDVEDIAEMFDQTSFDGQKSRRDNDKGDSLLTNEAAGDGQRTGAITGITTFSLPS